MRKIFKILIIIILIFWVVFSAFYILSDIFTKTINSKLNTAYQDGSRAILNNLLEQAKSCEPIIIFAGEQKIQLEVINCQPQTTNSTN